MYLCICMMGIGGVMDVQMERTESHKARTFQTLCRSYGRVHSKGEFVIPSAFSPYSSRQIVSEA